MKAGGIFSSHKYAGKTDDFRGLIYRPKNKEGKKKSKNNFTKYKHIEEEAEAIYCELEGSWLRELIIDGKEWWRIDDPEVRPQRHIANRV